MNTIRQDCPRANAVLSRRAIGTLILVVLFTQGCVKKTETAAASGPKGPEPIIVVLAPVKIEAVEKTILVTGSLMAHEQPTIAAKVSGRVKKIGADMGDRVAYGAELVRIDPADYEIAVAQAEAALGAALAKLGLAKMPAADFDPEKLPRVIGARLNAQNALSRFRRGEQLFREKPPLLDEQQFLDLKTTADMADNACDVEILEARAALADARAKDADLAAKKKLLADTITKAPELAPDAAAKSTPVHYAVASRWVEIGDFVLVGQKLFGLVADDPLKFRARVPERYLQDVRTGNIVRVTTDAVRTPREGRIVRIDPAVDMESRGFEIEAEMPNADGALRPGSFGRGEIVTGRNDNAVFVPEDAVVIYIGRKKVFTIKDGLAVEHTVKTGIARNGLIEVTEGLSGETAVVVTGGSKLTPGRPVHVKSAAEVSGESAAGNAAHPASAPGAAK